MVVSAVPWLEFLSLFAAIVGFVIGLGAVTVIDFHAFLGRNSRYWTEAAVRTHKITKPLIWVGVLLGFGGSILYYWADGWNATILLQAIIGVLLILNGLLLTFWVSPLLLRRERAGHADRLLPKRVQRMIAASFTFSLVGWWAELTLLVWHVVVLH